MFKLFGSASFSGSGTIGESFPNRRFPAKVSNNKLCFPGLDELHKQAV
jgi:hypothetical protein